MSFSSLGLLFHTCSERVENAHFSSRYVLVTASGVLASGTALNALSNHGACTVVFNVVTAIMITMASAVPRFSNLSYLGMHYVMAKIFGQVVEFCV